MEKAVLFNQQMEEIFGDRKGVAEPLLWVVSISMGIFFCKYVYEYMEAIFSATKTYKALTRDQQIEWKNRGFSTAHSILVSAVAAYLLVFSDFFTENAPYGPVVFRSTIFSQTIFGFSIGYFISDLSMILWFFPTLGGWAYILHHSFSMLSLALALHSGYAHVYIYMALLSEVTTPFVNLRWYLSTAGQSRTNMYIINGVLLLLTWMVFRVLLFMYLFIHLYLHYDQVKQIYTLGFYSLFTSPLMLAFMNLLWLRKIAFGLVKALKKKQK